MRYLDPKNDLTFKKIFGKHPNLAMSLLNALLPLTDDEQIVELEYLDKELVPEIPIFKDSMVDVRCKDKLGRHFIVEMQMLWTASFKSRVLFNASKAYVRQLGKGLNFSELKPVYALSIVNEVFEKGDQYYHPYRMVCDNDTEKTIDGLRLVFVELPKFEPKNWNEKRLRVLWLRFLKEIDDIKDRSAIPAELLDDPETRQALDILEESSFTPAELEYYDSYWDFVSRQRTLEEANIEKGIEKGMEKGMEKGIEIGIEKGIEIGEQIGLEKGRNEGRKEGEQIGLEKGRNEGRKEGEQIGLLKANETIIINGLHAGLTIPILAQLTNLSEKEVKQILKKNNLI